MRNEQGVLRKGDRIRRVGIVFSGGPAPAANAVISAAAMSFLEDDRQVIGFFHGYSSLQNYQGGVNNRLLPDTHYRVLTERDLRGLRNTRGILLGTARANPGRGIEKPSDLDDPGKTARLRNVYNAITYLEIDALISIGGDDTLRTANLLYLYQQRLPPGSRHFHVVHLPKTIDNDYGGIDFSLGFFTAVDVMAKELQNLRADAMSTSSYFIVETMGRKAGWLSYGVGIAGEANLVIAVEDIDDSMSVAEDAQGPETETVRKVRRLKLDALAEKIVELIITREKRGKFYGTVVLAEGLSNLLPEQYVRDVPRDEHGHISLGRIHVGNIVAQIVDDRYHALTGRRRKVTGVQLGYESRGAPPHAFDVMLGSQLGIGAYRALVEENLDGYLVGARGQLELCYVPFKDLINPETLQTEIRFILPGSDFHRLARFLETRTDKITDWSASHRLVE